MQDILVMTDYRCQMDQDECPEEAIVQTMPDPENQV